MEIVDLYKLYIQHGLVDTDTRNIRKNTIFFALKGENFNGNKFAEKALLNGAAFAIIDEIKYVTSKKTILVNDVLKTLQKLATYHRNTLGIPIISLTGSNGKTTTKELIKGVLSSQYKVTATKGNLNNHIGVPLTLLSMTKETEIGVVEMGANHQKEIAFLSEISNPDFGYITNFGSAHLEGFGSLNGVVAGKSELYDFLVLNNKKIFVNPEDSIQVEKTKKGNTIFFNKSIVFKEVNPFVKLLFHNIEIKSNLIGKYNFFNIAAAITIGDYFGVSKENIKKSIENYVPSNNRSQLVNTTHNKVILDAYNANPTSMKAALESFNNVVASNKTIILGDMFELGNYSHKEHQAIVELSSSLQLDNLFFIGEKFYKTVTKHHKFINVEMFKTYLLNNPLKENLILIKGSRGMALEQLVEFC
ncbi:UDP-N-acetylmuramoyl-tripeptide--D-alanyl-D-alanine ligase [Tenacibaculum soleae]|uniref:UDP-N-acetylmuramoyl-tripeptide--D-alanyl-D- alanine ligase n=1 Tax=Tenacibaculum soleae TaxID=447689 RepID=UPI0023001B2A|nr:UDP-N-acetylmuramoyl-tripeptide--D-alanyl-D-alanine ligase [Tenacibaculum soleae]